MYLRLLICLYLFIFLATFNGHSFANDLNDLSTEIVPSPFSELEQDGNTWANMHFFHYLDENRRWKLYGGGDLRLIDNSTSLRRSRVRFGVFYRFNENLQVALAKDYVRQLDPSANEARLWTQVQYYQPSLGLWRFDYRVRLEQRIIQDVSGVVWRTRYRLNAKRWLFGEERWYYRGWNELFVNLNRRPEFAQNNFAQYRIFNGIGFTPDNEITRYEGGYQMRYITSSAAADRIDHTLFLQMYVYW